MYKKIKLSTVFILCASLLITFLCGCSKAPDNILKIGVISGPEANLMQKAVDIAKDKYDLNAKIVEFQDYITPNIALSDGSIDVDAYQHAKYLKEMNNARNLKLVAVAKGFNYPLGAYSKKIKNIDDLQYGDKIAIPNDPSNKNRALKLLESKNLIKLQSISNKTLTESDVIDNPKKLKFIDIDSAQLSRSLDDVAIAIINSTYAVANNLLPLRDALFVEGSDSPYINLIVTREDNKNDPRIKKLIDAFQSQAVIDEAEKLFKGGAIVGWK